MQVPFLDVLMVVSIFNVDGDPLGVLQLKRRIELDGLSLDLSIINNIVTDLLEAEIAQEHECN